MSEISHSLTKQCLSRAINECFQKCVHFLLSPLPPLPDLRKNLNYAQPLVVKLGDVSRGLVGAVAKIVTEPFRHPWRFALSRLFSCFLVSHISFAGYSPYALTPTLKDASLHNGECSERKTIVMDRPPCGCCSHSITHAVLEPR